MSALFAAPKVHVEPRAGGGWHLRSGHALPANLPLVGERLAHWAAAAPSRTALVECRCGEAVASIGYGDVYESARRIAGGLRARGLAPERPLVSIAANRIDHALVRLGALLAGVPLAPLAPALVAMPGGADRLATIVRALQPGLIYADDPTAVRARLRDAGLDGIDVVNASGDLAVAPLVAGTRSLDEIAAIFFTSGSTGEPKGVLTTQRMLAANQAAYTVLWPFLADEPPRLLDWLPWHHTFGGNDNFHKMLWHGGTLYIDDGRPTPEQFDRTIANLRAVRPTLHINVPRGLELLLDAIDRDPSLREAFLAELRVVFFAGAGLAGSTWDRLRALAGPRVALVSGWGSTECGSTICLVHFPIDRPQIVGLPLPGYDLALAPAGDKLEARVRGPNVMPGYWTTSGPDRSAFDADGYYRTGDAVRFVDAARPAAGLVFDGRVAEDFKLATGAWVSVGPLRLALLAALAPLAAEVAIAGRDGPCVGVLLFIDAQACRRALGTHGSAQALAASPELRARVAARLATFNADRSGASSTVRRALLVAESPGADEVSDKGTLNQRLAVERRADAIARLFAPAPPADVITL